MISDKFPHSVKAIRNSDNKTITLARFVCLTDATEWMQKWGPEYSKPKWDFREMWLEIVPGK